MKDTFIIDGIRTPIGSFGGSLSPVRADDLLASTMKALMARNASLDPAQIEDALMGCANQAGEDNRNVARMATLLAGLPTSLGGETVNRLCASGMAAVVNASRAIKDGAGDVYLAGGVEHMTRAPWVLSKAGAAYGRDQQMFDSSFGWRFINPQMEALYGVDSMGMTAENLAEMFGISREDQDAFALWSQQKTAAAQEAGFFEGEMMEVVIPVKKGDPIRVVRDEFPKASTTSEKLAGLKPAFKPNGTVTAGNASGLNDGAISLLIGSEEGAKFVGKKPLVRIVSAAISGVEPRIMGIGPVEASKKALQRAGLSLDQMDVIELNEAFAAQVLACTRQLGLADKDPRINPNGGAIALGHPLGMTGARILLTAARQLNATGKQYALVAMCIGVGQGYATIIERV
ncbi:MAG: 3-oxoadipyl-CoA thiolase [Flavobacteriia bacterium]|nr:3-oxoadipyl-CoA thiolase [Flavobacteriia bacterium]